MSKIKDPGAKAAHPAVRRTETVSVPFGVETRNRRIDVAKTLYILRKFYLDARRDLKKSIAVNAVLSKSDFSVGIQLSNEMVEYGLSIREGGLA